MLQCVFFSRSSFATDRGIRRRQWRVGRQSRGATLCCLGSCSSPLAHSGDPRDKDKTQKGPDMSVKMGRYNQCFVFFHEASLWKWWLYGTWRHTSSWNNLQTMALKQEQGDHHNKRDKSNHKLSNKRNMTFFVHFVLFIAKPNPWTVTARQTLAISSGRRQKLERTQWISLACQIFSFLLSWCFLQPWIWLFLMA